MTRIRRPRHCAPAATMLVTAGSIPPESPPDAPADETDASQPCTHASRCDASVDAVAPADVDVPIEPNLGSQNFRAFRSLAGPGRRFFSRTGWKLDFGTVRICPRRSIRASELLPLFFGVVDDA